MLFVLLGVALLIMKLSGADPVADWPWVDIALPFLFAICWFELVEPRLGLDIRRQALRRRQFEARVRRFDKKTPRGSARGPVVRKAFGQITSPNRHR